MIALENILLWNDINQIWGLTLHRSQLSLSRMANYTCVNMSSHLEGRMESEDISKINHKGALLNIADTLASYSSKLVVLTNLTPILNKILTKKI